MAVVAAYGLPMAYPMLLPYLRRKHPRSMPGVHDVQYRLNQRLTGPGTAIILFAGVYMASKHSLWGEVWVTVPVAIMAGSGGRGGGGGGAASPEKGGIPRANPAARGPRGRRAGADGRRWARHPDCELSF